MGGISEQEVNKHGTGAVILSFMSSLEELLWSCLLDVLMKLCSVNGTNPAIILFKRREMTMLKFIKHSSTTVIFKHQLNTNSPLN
jgi:hypothetical protein